MKIKIIKSLGINDERITSFSIYTDTDSIFYPIEPLLIARHGKQDFTETEFIEKGLPLIDEVQSYINKSFDLYAKVFHNVTDHGWNIKQELIARRGFWSGKEVKLKKGEIPSDKTQLVEGVKKRYAQWIVNKKGVPKDYMDVKGLESVRSNFPTKFRQKLSEIYKSILHDISESDMNKMMRDFKKEILNLSIYDIMIPTSVNSVEDYDTGELGTYEKGTPVHVKAALNYNNFLKLNNIEAAHLVSGDKIIWCYLKDNPLHFQSIALSRETNPSEIIEFVESYIDKTSIFDKIFINKVQGYYYSIGWGKISLFVNNFF
jgi:DNA polymerase elongation subunit (family B)